MLQPYTDKELIKMILEMNESYFKEEIDNIIQGAKDMQLLKHCEACTCWVPTHEIAHSDSIFGRTLCQECYVESIGAVDEEPECELIREAYVG